jgi:excisionase family DNA binding protein
MDKITFDSLPDAISRLLEKVTNIEKLLLENNHDSKSDPDQFLTIREAAKFLRISVPTLYGRVHDSSIPVCKRGKRLYFSKNELTEWVFQGRKKTAFELKKEANLYLSNSKRNAQS